MGSRGGGAAQAQTERPDRPTAAHDGRTEPGRSAAPAAGAPAAQPAPPVGEMSPLPATLGRSLQRAVEDRAAARDVRHLREGSVDAGLLQRKVTVGTKLYSTREKLPAIPPTTAARYQGHALAAITAIVEGWRDDAITANRTWPDPTRLYQAAIDQFLTQGRTEPVSTAAPWARLAFAVGREDANGLVEIPWASFGAGAAALEDELKQCNVQISSNSTTTACHGNSHGKLPKKVVVPGGGLLAALPSDQQPLHTPYYEFLIPGHKSDIGIERGILDRNSRQIYITAHYETGSFVWLSGAPKALLDNWATKARKYRRQLMKPT